MDADELKKIISEIKSDAKAKLEESSSLDRLRQIEAQIVGKKGRLGALLGSIAKFPTEVRGSIGQVLNAAKKDIAGLFEQKRSELHASESAARVVAIPAISMSTVSQSLGCVTLMAKR